MLELTNDQIDEVNGGIGVLGVLAIAAVVVLVAGVIDGAGGPDFDQDGK